MLATGVGPRSFPALPPPETEYHSGEVPPDETRRVPKKPPDSTGEDLLAPTDASVAEQYDHYKLLVESRGGTVSDQGATVVGLRGECPNRRIHKTVVCKGYSDTFVVLNRSADGTPRVTTLLGATYPAQVSFAGRGVSIIQPGGFLAIPGGLHYGVACYEVLRLADLGGALPSWRDLNMNGRFSDTERQRPFTATEILFHVGKADSVSSAGCQTLPPPQMEQFIAAVGGPDASFHFTLVETGGY